MVKILQQDTVKYLLILNSVYLIHLGSYRASHRLLLGLLGVTEHPFRTLDTLAGITQSRKFTVCTIGARNGIWILGNIIFRVDKWTIFDSSFSFAIFMAR